MTPIFSSPVLLKKKISVCSLHCWLHIGICNLYLCSLVSYFSNLWCVCQTWNCSGIFLLPPTVFGDIRTRQSLTAVTLPFLLLPGCQGTSWRSTWAKSQNLSRGTPYPPFWVFLESLLQCNFFKFYRLLSSFAVYPLNLLSFLLWAFYIWELVLLPVPRFLNIFLPFSKKNNGYSSDQVTCTSVSEWKTRQNVTITTKNPCAAS